MSKRATPAAILIALTAINVALLPPNLTSQAQANVLGRSDLVRDLRRAVSTIVEDCTASETIVVC